MLGSNRFSSFMISDILKCDKKCDQDIEDLDQSTKINSHLPIDYSLFKSFVDQTNYSELSHESNYWSNSSNDSGHSGIKGPSVDTILLQHYLLRQRMLMQAKPRKGGQIRFTSEQSVALEKQFNRQKYLSPPERKNIAIELGLTERQIKTWFQNRRAKWRRCKQTNDDLDSDKHIFYNKYKPTHSCSGDNDNEDHFDRYHSQNSTHHNHISVDFTLINLT